MNKKNKLREELYKRDGRKCHYCGIGEGEGEDEGEFIRIWDYFYPKKPPYKTGKGRGKRLEIDHKDNDNRDDSLENCVLACSICNNAKSDKFTYEEFKKVGKVIKQIWNERESQLRKKVVLT